MSVWGWGTELAIWTLLLGSVAVFTWFLIEVVRIARRRKRQDRTPPSFEDTDPSKEPEER